VPAGTTCCVLFLCVLFPNGVAFIAACGVMNDDGHQMKLMKQFSRVNSRAFCFSNHCTDAWNSPSNDFCRAMLCISAAYAVMRCLCVCLCVCVCVCVTFVHCVKTNEDIFNFFTVG